MIVKSQRSHGNKSVREEKCMAKSCVDRETGAENSKELSYQMMPQKKRQLKINPSPVADINTFPLMFGLYSACHTFWTIFRQQLLYLSIVFSESQLSFTRSHILEGSSFNRV